MTYFLFSLGCKVNSYECSALASMLRKLGYFEDRENPDVVIINTCSVTATADQKSRQHIRKFQKQYPSAIIVVMGCYAQGHSDFIANDINADIIVGTSHRNEIPTLIEEYLRNHKQIVKVDKNTRTLCYEDFGVTSYSENIRAYLKIQDGCNNFCSYCLIPYRRGNARSRSKESILEEARYLVHNHYQEIVLTGIDVSSYGVDLGHTNLYELVKELINIEGLESLRISSIEAHDMSEELLYLYKNNKVLAKHIHIPLQSGSKTVLERMHRKYQKEDFLKKIKLLRSIMPEIMISTDVIVGFPGESDEEFLETKEFIKECGFNQLHVFPFSSRKETLAAKMPNQVNDIVKKQRVSALLQLSKELWDEYVSHFINKEVEVLVEKYDVNKKVNIGHTTNYIEVAIPSLEGKVGQRITVKLEKSMIVS
ncbi:MAG: tRNA (N(6)-L-threonylcarbamoyladenosine(37)-C(2))-methylthiotransferase MtaB [Bacilli bacterium]|nr:tRNA (N(6)-L-threonylcarbamoyladenosine(37)-C(2))-methylthiotransferase MtaB [Bacilli bacterium]